MTKDTPAATRADAGQPGQLASRRRLLLQASALASASVLPGLSACGGGDDGDTVATDTASASGGPAATAPAPAPATPPANAVAARVSFRAPQDSAVLDSRYAGLSYEKNKLTEPLFTASNAPLIALFRLLGPSVLRLGANAVDRSSWNGVQGGTPILPAQVDALAAFVQATGWQVIYAVNLATNTPQNAAAEATYVAQALGSALLAWEIGNEPDLYRRHGYRPQSWGYDDFLEEYREIRDAMRQAVPNVPFSGPGTAFNLATLSLPFARDEGDDLAYLTHHYYRADRNDPNSTLRLLLASHTALRREVRALVEAAEDAGIEGGVRLTEANSFFNGGLQNVSNAFGTGLWVIDFMFTCAVNGCRGVNMHGGGSGPGYTPIAERQGTVIEARPVFYGMLLFSRGAEGRSMSSVLEPAPAANVTAWGVQRSNRGFNAVLLNKDPERSANLTLRVGEHTSATRFDPLWLRGTALDQPTGQTLGEAGITATGNWTLVEQAPLAASNGELTVLVPPHSAVLLRSL